MKKLLKILNDHDVPTEVVEYLDDKIKSLKEDPTSLFGFKKSEFDKYLAVYLHSFTDCLLAQHIIEEETAEEITALLVDELVPDPDFDLEDDEEEEHY